MIQDMPPLPAPLNETVARFKDEVSIKLSALYRALLDENRVEEASSLMFAGNRLLHRLCSLLGEEE